MFRVVAISLVLVTNHSGWAQEPKKADLSKEPQWKRTLKGPHAKQAAEWEKEISELEEAKKPAEASVIAQKLLGLRRREQGADHWKVRDQEIALQKLKHPQLSDEVVTKLLDAVKQSDEVDRLISAGELDKAVTTAREIVKVYQKHLGEKSTETGAMENYLAVTLMRAGRFPDAEQHIKNCLAITREAYGESHPNYVAPLANYGSFLGELRRYSEAESVQIKAVAILRDVYGDDHASTAAVLHNLASTEAKLSKLEAAERHFREALSIRMRLSQESSLEIASSQSCLGSVLNDLGRYKEAEPLLEKAYSTDRTTRGGDPASLANSMVNLAANRSAVGRLSDAIALYEKAIPVWVARFGNAHPDTALTRSNLALLYQQLGRLDDAERLLRQSLESLIAFHGKEHPHSAKAMGNLASVYHSKGKYAIAQRLGQEAYGIQLKSMGANHEDTLSAMNGLAATLSIQGRHDEAVQLMKLGLTGREKLYGKKHLTVAVSLNNLGSIHELIGKFKEAADFQRQSIETFESIEGDHREGVARSLSNLGLVQMSLGEHDEAIRSLRRSVGLWEDARGSAHAEVQVARSNLASAYDRARKPELALPLHKQALSNWLLQLGALHPLTARGYLSTGTHFHRQGKFEEAIAAYLECSHAHESARLLGAASVERSIASHNSSPYLFLASAQLQKERSAEAFASLERELARGTLDELEARNELANPPGRLHELSSQLKEIEKRHAYLSKLHKPTTEETSQLEQLVEKRSVLEKEHLVLSARRSSEQVASVAQIQSRLRAGQALILWLDAATPDSIIQEHWACVLRETGTPRWERLKGTGELGAWTVDDSFLPFRFRDAIAFHDDAVDKLSKALHAQRIQPVLKHLDGVKTLFVVGVNEMAGVPIEALTSEYAVGYVPSGTFLARRMKPSASPNSLLAFGDPIYELGVPKLPPGGLLIQSIANPNGVAAKANILPGDVLLKYAGTAVNSLEELKSAIDTHSGSQQTIELALWRIDLKNTAIEFTKKVPTGPLGVILSTEPATKAIAERRKFNAMFERDRGGLLDLPGSRVEVERIGKLFDQRKIFTDGNAGEPTLDKLRADGELGKFRYLHFATHGRGNRLRAFESSLILSQDHPMESLSKPNAQCLDNQLTAREVLDHWKLDADLVTLSACETAIGRSAGGDGLLGFAQAFLLAGSRSVCLSLWKVDDTATGLLMVRFYENLLGKRTGIKPMRKIDALQEAKEWLKALTGAEANKLGADLWKGVERGEIRDTITKPKKQPEYKPEAKPYTHPKYWAAFILIGDPD